MEERMVVGRVGGLNVDMTVIQLRTLTSHIHAAFIFEPMGSEILRKILVHVGATPVEMDDSNWMAFGDRLGVEHQQLQNIQNYFQGQQGPVWWVLATYVQLDEAVVERVIFALSQIERYDVINLIDDDVREFAHRVSIRRRQAAVIRPGHVLTPAIPWVPHLLRPENSEGNNVWRVENAVAMIPNPPVQGVCDRIDDDPVFVPVYTVLLTYANDGTNAAHRITQILRTYNPRIGVLLFNEQMLYLFERDHEFVTECLAQVDTIMPILTQGYYDTINARPGANEIPLGRDQELARWIFKTLGAEYMRNNCINRRVRCIVPNENTNALEVNPVFGAYMAEAKIRELIELLLGEKLGRGGLAALRREQRT